MTDVRLTALNPEDSTVVPVACNSSGELLVDKGEPEGPDLNVEGDLSVGGSASFAGIGTFGPYDISDNAGTGVQVNSGGVLRVQRGSSAGAAEVFQGYFGSTNTSSILADGSAEFAGPLNVVTTQGANNVATFESSGVSSYGLKVKAGGAGPTNYFADFRKQDNSSVFKINGDSSIEAAGSAQFKGDVVVGSRSKSWMLVEQGGLCQMVEQTRSLIDEGFSVDAVDADYPKLRDVFSELDLIEKSLSQVMEKLRLTPPAGWPVWDGSDETQ